MMRGPTTLVLVSMMLLGCQDVIDLDPVDTRSVVEASVRPRPITGGTLAIAGGLAIAADPDRDAVYVVDLVAGTLASTVALQAGDEPGRVIVGRDGVAHVVLRGSGSLASIDIQQGTVLARHAVCPDPRGIAYDSVGSTVDVACADGTLVSLDELSGLELDRRFVAADLRDPVRTADGSLLVSRFRAASLVSPDGGSEQPAEDGADFASNVAWRTWSDGLGRVYMLHQQSSTEPVPIQPSADDLRDNDLPYGGGGEGFCTPGITTPAITVFEQGEQWSMPIIGAPLTVDAAVSPSGEWLAIAMPGAGEDEPSVGVTPVGPETPCFFNNVPVVDQQVTSVAFTTGGRLVLQSREPAALIISNSDRLFDGYTTIPLSDTSTFDTGHEIFHRRTESGLSCASCHPEGTDDGHVWKFESLGRRRTQPLDVGLEGTAPFHWDGDMDDLDVLMTEVLAHRMGGMRQSPERSASFDRWLFAQERPPARSNHDDASLVAEGQALFAQLDCVRCHDADGGGATLTTPIRNKPLQVPSLRRVSLRPPFMHDGRAATLEDAVVDMIETTTGSTPESQSVTALAAYLRTL